MDGDDGISRAEPRAKKGGLSAYEVDHVDIFDIFDMPLGPIGSLTLQRQAKSSFNAHDVALNESANLRASLERRRGAMIGPSPM